MITYNDNKSFLDKININMKQIIEIIDNKLEYMNDVIVYFNNRSNMFSDEKVVGLCSNATYFYREDFNINKTLTKEEVIINRFLKSESISNEYILSESVTENMVIDGLISIDYIDYETALNLVKWCDACLNTENIKLFSKIKKDIDDDIKYFMKTNDDEKIYVMDINYIKIFDIDKSIDPFEKFLVFKNGFCKRLINTYFIERLYKSSDLEIPKKTKNLIIESENDLSDYLI